MKNILSLSVVCCLLSIFTVVSVSSMEHKHRSRSRSTEREREADSPRQRVTAPPSDNDDEEDYGDEEDAHGSDISSVSDDDKDRDLTPELRRKVYIRSLSIISEHLQAHRTALEAEFDAMITQKINKKKRRLPSQADIDAIIANPGELQPLLMKIETLNKWLRRIQRRINRLQQPPRRDLQVPVLLDQTATFLGEVGTFADTALTQTAPTSRWYALWSGIKVVCSAGVLVLTSPVTKAALSLVSAAAVTGVTAGSVMAFLPTFLNREPQGS